MDTVDLQYLGCDGWLGIKAIHGSRPATAAAGVCRQGGSAARPNSARRRPRPVSAGAQCRTGAPRVPHSPRLGLSARQGVGPDQHWQVSSPVLLSASLATGLGKGSNTTPSIREATYWIQPAFEHCSAVVCHPITEALVL